MCYDQPIEPTYETGTDEPIHPDFMVASRFIEVAMSDCEYGCKIYADPRSNVKVLGHNKTYGCNVTSSWIAYQNDVAMGESNVDALV
jgi:hypothetical protein